MTSQWKPVQPEMSADMEKMYQAGHGVPFIAEKVGLAESKVRRCLKRIGVQFRTRGVKGIRADPKAQRGISLKYSAADPRRRQPRGKPIMPEVYAEMRHMYQAGHGVPFIAEEVGLTKSKVRRCLERIGVKFRPRGVKGVLCIEPDCRKPTRGARRCPLCRRLRKAALNLETVREIKGVKNPIANHFYDRAPAEETIGIRLKPKRSGRYGPTVLQLETEA